LIGHTKDFVNDRHFERFLARLGESGDVRFRSMSEVIRDMNGAPRTSVVCQNPR